MLNEQKKNNWFFFLPCTMNRLISKANWTLLEIFSLWSTSTQHGAVPARWLRQSWKSSPTLMPTRFWWSRWALRYIFASSQRWLNRKWDNNTLFITHFRSTLTSARRSRWNTTSHRCPHSSSSRRASRLTASVEPMLRSWKSLSFNTRRNLWKKLATCNN